MIKECKKYTEAYSNELIERELKINELGNHPNILQVLGYHTNGEVRNGLDLMKCKYILYEICQAPTVGDIVKYTGELGVLCKLPFFQLCSAVQFLHNNKCCHLDLKLNNLLLDSNYNIKLADFG